MTAHKKYVLAKMFIIWRTKLKVPWRYVKRLYNTADDGPEVETIKFFRLFPDGCPHTSKDKE